MTTQLDDAVELLERSLAYTRTALLAVDESSDGNLGAPTPCSRWDLAALLDHMSDALDAFTEAAAGLVDVRRRPPASGAGASRVDGLQLQACTLLGAWLDAPPERVDIGGAGLAAPVLVATSALEITVHGWDVARAIRFDHRIPLDLAERLREVAAEAVQPADRPARFAETVPLPPYAHPDERLLAELGRDPAPRFRNAATPA